MTIYLDIVFLENLLMNYIILYGTGLILKTKMKNIRLILGSIIGAVYAIITYLEIIPAYSNIFMKIILSIIIIYVAFNPQNVKKMVKTLAIFYLISFVTGGCALALLYLIAPGQVVFENGVLVGTYPMKITVIAGAVGFLIIQYSFRANKRNLRNKDLICKLKIKICGKLIETKAFLDSGNNLKDPLTQEPVVIVEKALLEKFMQFDQEKFEVKTDIQKVKMRLIPFKSIGKQNGLLMGIKTEYIEIKYDEEETIINNVVLGIYNKKISKNYSALIGLDLLQGGNSNEYSSDSKEDIFWNCKR